MHDRLDFLKDCSQVHSHIFSSKTAVSCDYTTTNTGWLKGIRMIRALTHWQLKTMNVLVGSIAGWRVFGNRWSTERNRFPEEGIAWGPQQTQPFLTDVPGRTCVMRGHCVPTVWVHFPGEGREWPQCECEGSSSEFGCGSRSCTGHHPCSMLLHTYFDIFVCVCWYFVYVHKSMSFVHNHGNELRFVHDSWSMTNDQHNFPWT